MDFNTHQLPRLNKLWDYYQGRQQILSKFYEDSSKPCNKTVVNFCKDIVDNYQGFLTGKDVTYSLVYGDITPIQTVLNYNDVAKEDSELLKQMLIFGVGFEVMWIDEDGKTRFAVVDSRQCIPVYYNTLDHELACVIRFYKLSNIKPGDDKYYVDLYTPTTVQHFTATPNWSDISMIGAENHFFKQVPITVAQLNDDCTGIFEQIMGLQDSYNTIYNAEIDDEEAFVNAYVVFKGLNPQLVGEIAPLMREQRVIALEDTNASVEYLTKDMTISNTQAILDNTEKKIRVISHSPDFTDESFGTASGIALQNKLVGFLNAAAAIEKDLIKALQRRIELITTISSLVEGEDMWRDVQIVIDHNLPTDLLAIAQSINAYRGLVSDKTLLAQVPFVQDVDAELEQKQEQDKENMELYNFGGDNDVLDSKDKQSE